MRIGRTLPPAASPISIQDILKGIISLSNPGKPLMAFRQSISNYFGVKYSFLLSSGKAAISVSLKALSKLLPNRRRVIVPAFNCYSVPSAIINAGFDVYPCDIDPYTLQIQKESLLKALSNTDDVLAIIPAHLFGLPAPIPWIYQISSKAGIPVIEDAAQAMGSSYNGKLLGTQADIGIFSLSRGKAFSTGEGGIIITSRDDIGETIEQIQKSIPSPSLMWSAKLLLKNIATAMMINPQLFWLPKSIPALKLGETIFNSNFEILKLGDLQAALASKWKNRLQKLLCERSIRNRYYSRYLNGIEGVVQITSLFNLTDFTGIRYPLLLADNNNARKILQISHKSGLGITSSYPDILNHIKELNVSSEIQCKNALTVPGRLITLPSHPFVTCQDMENIVMAIRSVVEG
ncbi:MAG: aminotransferase DegT [Fibrobacter sp.]|jgi:perosamine synthetase|nr:aminotransferase DegT [Fibrobacter sp.]